MVFSFPLFLLFAAYTTFYHGKMRFLCIGLELDACFKMADIVTFPTNISSMVKNCKYASHL